MSTDILSELESEFEFEGELQPEGADPFLGGIRGAIGNALGGLFGEGETGRDLEFELMPELETPVSAQLEAPPAPAGGRGAANPARGRGLASLAGHERRAPGDAGPPPHRSRCGRWGGAPRRGATSRRRSPARAPALVTHSAERLAAAGSGPATSPRLAVVQRLKAENTASIAEAERVRQFFRGDPEPTPDLRRTDAAFRRPHRARLLPVGLAGSGARPLGPDPAPFSVLESGIGPATYRRGVTMARIGRLPNPSPLAKLPYRRSTVWSHPGPWVRCRTRSATPCRSISACRWRCRARSGAASRAKACRRRQRVSGCAGRRKSEPISSPSR